MLTMPGYIKESGVVGAPVSYDWNDAFPESHFPEDERLGHRIAKTRRRGVVALSSGFAEWIAWRFRPLVDTAVLLSEIEAVWAGIVDWRYVRPLATSPNAPARDAWQGPERGPVRAAFRLLSQVVTFVKKSSYPADASSALSNLASYVMPDPKPFKEWRRFAVQRLAELYPTDMKDMLGPAIPREVLDPGIDYKPGMANALLASYLQSLDYEKNPFLRSPEEMMAEGFQGTPYIL